MKQTTALALIAALFTSVLVPGALAQKEAPEAHPSGTTPPPINPNTQNTPGSPTTAADDAARAEDVESLDGMMRAIYDVISGPAGAPRDWARFRSLFIEGARLIPINPASEAGARVLSPEDYVERGRATFAENPFYESEIARKVDRFGAMAHVFSTYEARRAPDEAPFLRGINSFQLLNHAGRWWIVTIYWQAEDAQTPLPDQYLPPLPQ